MDHSFLKRLAFVKYLYNVGSTQCQGVEPFASAGLLTLHDALELFLDLACEHLNVTEKIKEMKDYWGAINAKLAPNALAQQTAVMRLNKARVSLKHHGAHPSKMDLQSYRVAAQAFFAENSPLVFDVSLDELSMAEFVSPAAARHHVEAAIQKHAEGKFDEAVEDLTVAFELVRDDYVDRKADASGRSPYTFGVPTLLAEKHFDALIPITGTGPVHAIDNTVRSVRELRRAMQVIALGFDFRKYLRFTSLGPIFWAQDEDGQWHFHDEPNPARNAETIQFCIDFVIECSLRLAEFDYDAE